MYAHYWFSQVFCSFVFVFEYLFEFAFNPAFFRAAKCHGYGGYIRVKILEGWGKKSGRVHNFAKSSIVLGKFEQLMRIFSLNLDFMIECSAFVPQK